MKNDIDLMVEIANMYFIERKTEQEIADILFFSRSKISRLIKKAIDTGIVNISINYPTTRLKDVEMKLKLRFGVTDAIVIQTKEQNDSLNELCKLAGTYIDELISDDMTSNSVWQSTITDKQKAEYIAQGARATFLAHIIDKDGNLVGQEYDSHLVTMSMQEIQNVPNVVCVASGAKKSKALLAVLKSGLIKTLIIDDVLAKTILEME